MDNTLHFEVDGRTIVVTAKYITPAEAKDLLARNKRNRPLTQRRVDQLVNDIRDGVFKFNGDAVRLASDGSYDDLLLDAQHRLAACIESDTAIPVLIVSNLDPDVSDTIDQGEARSVADILRVTYGMAMLLWVGSGKGTNPPRPMLAQYINENIETFFDYASEGMTISDASPTVAVGSRMIKAMAPAPLAALMGYMIEQGGNPILVRDFFWRIATGTVSDSDMTNVIPAVRRRQMNGLPLNRIGSGAAMQTLFAEYHVYITQYGRWMEGSAVQHIRGPVKEIRTFADLPKVWQVERV